ncbi:MAG TPA: hypothetical protein VFY25_14135 [Anaerolineales bacterium]|nr:hypothetical protein [Anaerolineales bacterium]
MLVLDVSSETLLHSIFHTLAYADVFDYPLTAEEVYRYLTSARASPQDVLRALGDEECFARVGDYFTLRGREHIVETRKRRAGTSARLWTHALRYGRMIALLPFVRMVAVTGSLAMNNADEGKDIDFMIVTEPGHLWTARALSLLIARYARLTGVHLCPNYLITTNALQLQDRSVYVAHELAQMIPLSGMDVYGVIRRLNRWVDDYLPNACDAPELPEGSRIARTWIFIRGVLELIFRFPLFTWFETWEMNRKAARLRREQSASFESYFSADICKGHIDRHGENAVTALAVRLQLPPLPLGEGRGEGI